ncbi:Hypothetical predicted protein [Mytilus galloprovincialis]|uniref:DUF229 domain containing protein n=1 Tax=Mytilus galloprovincialis TaxID=29158 RepID=A0A8B6CPQ7_MYTGA|nr:Hypothetical predicted protein [Mytilus galloprovincialis]
MFPLRVVRRRLAQLLRNYNLLKRLVLIGGIFMLSSYSIYHLYWGPGYMSYVHGNIWAKCMIPQVNPFDKEIMKFYWKPDPIVCSKETDLVYFDYNATLHINKTRTRGKIVTCNYQEIKRHKDDKTLELGNEVWFNNSVIVKTDFVNVNCFINKKKIYSRLHLQVYRSDKTVKTKKNGGKNYNILMFGLDSVSRLAAIRELPKTLKYLETNLSGYVLKGYTKVADTTLPNLAPVMTGHYAFTKEFPVIPNLPYDNHPFIWRNFSALGAATFFSEDWPRLCTYNLETSGGGGFSNPPTNHYMRPFYLAINEMKLFEAPLADVLQFFEDKNFKLRDNSYLCYGDNPMHVLAIEYLKRFLIAYRHDFKFAKVWNNKLSHNYVNFIKLADDDLLDLLIFMKTEGFLDDSFLFFMSDHGSRVDKIRNTPIGRLEERLPLMSVVIPEHIKQKYPNLHENLETNIDRLTSPFDIHKTMVDILNENFQPKEVGQPYPRGISLFRPIPEDRSCANAGIDEHNCVCYSSEKVETKMPVIQKLTSFVISHINEQLPKDICADLKLKKILAAKRVHTHLTYDQQTQNKKPLLYFFYKPKDDTRERYLLVLQLSPSDGVFEATVEHQNEKDFNILGDISRTNRYGNQSLCIHDMHLRHYCYCK